MPRNRSLSHVHRLSGAMGLVAAALVGGTVSVACGARDSSPAREAADADSGGALGARGDPPARRPPGTTSATTVLGDITLEEHWIPMPDGVRLAADLWRPATLVSGQRFPVLLEYLPYRKTEARSDRRSLYAYFVRRGYVVARVDIRGTGNSEGTLIPHEYSEIELADGERVIEWLAEQPFSTGAVGMFGISWSGFNALMLARRHPAALKAIVALHATEELYQEDVHFMDGMMHVDSWEMSQDLANAMPGAPDYRIDERYFAERFDQPPWFLVYKRQQRDGPFWDRASLRTDYAALTVPTFVIGGWYDGYRDAVPRLLQRLRAPVKAILGPWSHAFPHAPQPGPGIEWRHEAVRWFDQWLKGVSTGILAEPRLAYYARRWHPPGPTLDSVPGRWRTADAWPIPGLVLDTLLPTADGTLARRDGAARAPVPNGAKARRGVPAREAVRTLRYVPSSGIEAGGPVMWFGDVPPDLAPGDTFGLSFDTAPLPNDLEILGLPRVQLTVSASAPQAHWLARLSDVAPDGRVTLVASAGFNGAHRRSPRAPQPLVPGERDALELELHATSWTFPRGHRVRLTVTNAQWPMIWPTPWPMTTTLVTGAAASRVILPVLPAGLTANAPTWGPIAAAEPPIPGYAWEESGTTSGFGEVSRMERDPTRGRTRVIATSNTARRLPWGRETTGERITHETFDERPDSSSVHGEYFTQLQLTGRTLRWEADVRVRSDTAAFHYEHRRRLYENGVLRRERTWRDRIPRDHQ